MSETNKNADIRPAGGPRGTRGLVGKPQVKVNKKTVRRLLSYFGKYKFHMVAVFAFILISSLASVLSSLFLETLIDDYITPMLAGTVGVDEGFNGLFKALAVMGLIYISGALSSFFYNRLMAVVSQGILKQIRDAMFSHMQTLPIKYFDSHSFGDTMSFYTNDTDSLRQMISQSVPQALASITTIITIFVSMLRQSIWLTLFVIVFLLVIIKIMGFVGGKSGKYFVKQQRSVADLNGYIEEMINGQKVVKVFCHEDKAKEEFDKKNEELCYNMTKANSYGNNVGPIMNNMGYLLYVAIAILGGALAINSIPNLSLLGWNTLSLGVIASFLTLSRSFVQPISQISQQINAIALAMAGAERIFTLIDEPSEEDNGYVTLVNAKVDDKGKVTETPERTGVWAWKHPHGDGSVTYTRLMGNVVLDDVDFEYEKGKPVLHNISLYAEPGQKVAFVGATGAGKTTITNLINRFYDIADGKIRYDGININKIKKPDLRRSMGIVLQDVNLFTGTVMENIRYGRLTATDEECIAAAKLANADSFIRMLPDGYDTVLSGDGSGLSQGQRQLISIARAAVADPPVMILDEATSSIDTRTEAIVQRGMDALMKGRTVFVIAHRLSTVKNSDVIMVLDHGRIIERGNHEKLIAERGSYYRLYTGSFELE